MNELSPQQEMDHQEKMMERQQAGDPNSVYADSMREEKIKNIISQLNPEALLSEIEHRIRGERKNEYTQDWETIKDGKKVSEKLIQNYISFLNPYLTQNTSLANFSPEEINNIMYIVIDYVKSDLTDNAELYELTTRTEITRKKKVKLLKPHINENGLNCVTYEEVEIEEKTFIGDEVTDYNELTRIGHIVCQSTFSVFKQAQDGMLAQRIFKALRVTGDINGGQKSKLDVLKFW